MTCDLLVGLARIELATSALSELITSSRHGPSISSMFPQPATNSIRVPYSGHTLDAPYVPFRKKRSCPTKNRPFWTNKTDTRPELSPGGYRDYNQITGPRNGTKRHRTSR